MALSDIGAVEREVTVKFKDGTSPTALSFTIPKRIASLDLPRVADEYVWVESLGTRVGRKKIRDALYAITIRCVFTEFTNSTAIQIADLVDWLNGSSPTSMSSWVSTSSAAFDGRSVSVELTVDKTSGDKDDAADAVTTYTQAFATSARVDFQGGDNAAVFEVTLEALGRTQTGISS